MPSSARDSGKPDIPHNLKPYFLCLLRRGERWNVTEGYEDLMPEYLAYLRREMEARRIVLAGPVTDEGDLIAVAVIETATMQEARALVAENPAIKSGHFVAEVHPCYLPGLDGVRVEY
ncbi:MAG TPA: YciI family protein [Silvibacterium sp.]|nr:YciI family protein [Silvibacterium sp.]